MIGSHDTISLLRSDLGLPDDDEILVGDEVEFTAGEGVAEALAVLESGQFLEEPKVLPSPNPGADRHSRAVSQCCVLPTYSKAQDPGSHVATYTGITVGLDEGIPTVFLLSASAMCLGAFVTNMLLPGTLCLGAYIRWWSFCLTLRYVSAA